MTRINCVPPAELTRQHLVAEYRELPRVFALVRAAQRRGERPEPEGQYRLGAGHVRFFFSRLGYLLDRQIALIAEMERRGFRPSFTDPASLSAGIDPEWFGSWTPDDAALALNRQRISERLPGAKPEPPRG